jgi:hypothetical protein
VKEIVTVYTTITLTVTYKKRKIRTRLNNICNWHYAENLDGSVETILHMKKQLKEN